MALYFHELRRDRLKLIIWTGAIAFMLCTSICIYPMMAEQMNEMSELFSQMGEFSSAFNMDQINYGEFGGYFAVECGNVLGLGGAFFAALLGIAALAKEEHDRTAEFLLAHPVSRTYVVGQKLAAVLTEVLLLNLGVSLLAIVASFVIGQSFDLALLITVLFGYLLMQIEIACLMFGLSAFLRGNGIGIGIGVALVFYFMNLLANITEEVSFLRYLTPFSYADGTSVAATGTIEIKYLIPGMALTVLGIVIAFVKYRKKDIQA